MTSYIKLLLHYNLIIHFIFFTLAFQKKMKTDVHTKKIIESVYYNIEISNEPKNSIELVFYKVLYKYLI